MPYPAKTDLETIVIAAQKLIERDGIDQLSLGSLAAELSIKPPSLYRHVAGKSEVVRAVNERTFTNLFDAYDAALSATGNDAEAQLWAIFRTHRAYARANPATYVLAFSSPGQRGDEQILVRLVLPVQKIMSKLTGRAQSLSALRGALALVHGFIMLELNGQFQRDGDLTQAFEEAVAAYLRGWRRSSN